MMCAMAFGGLRYIEYLGHEEPVEFFDCLGTKGGTGIPEYREDMPGKSLNEYN